jgi:hypothetical protein
MNIIQKNGKKKDQKKGGFALFRRRAIGILKDKIMKWYWYLLAAIISLTYVYFTKIRK